MSTNFGGRGMLSGFDIFGGHVHSSNKILSDSLNGRVKYIKLVLLKKLFNLCSKFNNKFDSLITVHQVCC